MAIALPTGFVVLQGNRLELLRDEVFRWFARYPLDPLEDEVVLVQSNATADWLKMSMAASTGVCAAMRLELPGRFVWRMYRAVLGGERVAAQSALDRDALVWRLMRELPRRLHQPIFAPVADFLADGDVERRLQLAERLADLFDQYQVYRADWLDAWLSSDNVVTDSDGRRRKLSDDQRWQPALWRDLVRALDAAEVESIRPSVHRVFLEAMTTDVAPVTALPRRVVLFGASHVSTQGLEALAALSSRMQVVLAIPNPSRYYWGDILDGREALRAAATRHPSRGSTPLATVPLEAMHLHAHPLLAAWGRQGRDFIRQLDAFAEAHALDASLAIDELDHFDESEPTSLLGEVQAAIRDLEPLAEHVKHAIAADDRSIAFAVCHSPQREIEVLHDRLLALFAEDDATLAPRDVIVMVPDIDRFAPSIRAVFGQHDRDDARRIPYDIADLRNRGSNPLIVAVEWLLRLPDQRVRAGELRDLLDVPAIAARFGLDADGVRQAFAWADGAAVRWGLNLEHREALGLEACGAQNTWAFGIERLLLGYATGAGPSFDAVDPVGDVGGLEAASIGALAEVAARLEEWRRTTRTDATPEAWSARCRTLLDAFIAASDERERVVVAALEQALADWVEACAVARFDDPVPLSVMREGWLGRLDRLEDHRRFLTGGVTFCTLLPLRAVPFAVVCLVGMNDGDFPRASRRDDFDLLAVPGLQRPGDRSRRDDDRYLMLEALLAARRVLYVSWTGRSARDNSVRPPSVLVAQLRDYLDAGWTADDGGPILDTLTTEHPLQPFSRRYFEKGGLLTFAREWRDVHDLAEPAVPTADDTHPMVASARSLTIRKLQSFLRNPVRAFFRDRLDINVRDENEHVDEDEAFVLDGLDRWQVLDMLVRDATAGDPGEAARRLDDALARVAASGRLPLLDGGVRDVAQLRAIVAPMLAHWRRVQEALGAPAPRRAVRLVLGDVTIDDWLDGLRADARGEAAWFQLTASRLFSPDGKSIQQIRLLNAWVEMLVASAAGHPMRGFVIGCDGAIEVSPLDRVDAEHHLSALVDGWRAADRATSPPAFEAKTALAAAARQQSPRVVYEGGSQDDAAGEVARDFALARAYPTYAALVANGFEAHVERLFVPLVRWIATHVEDTSEQTA